MGAAVAEWVMQQGREHGGFEAELLDLKAIDLPMLSEPHHPRLQKYTQESTKRWGATVAALDSFVFVTPEYNFGSPPALINALDTVYVEWAYKPVGFVSYGGVSGGLRSVQMTKMMLTTFKLVPIVEAVSIPFIAKELQDGRFPGNERVDTAAAAMLDELLRCTNALKPLRTQ